MWRPSAKLSFSSILAFTTVVLALAVTPLPTAAQPPSPDGPPSSDGLPVNDFPFVGMIGSIEAGGHFCTGTLISSTGVLTSAQCALSIADPSDGFFTVGNQTYATSAIIIHPDYDVATASNDIAVLTLDEPVLDVEPSQPFREQPVVNDVLFVVGFGSPDAPEPGSPGSFGTLNLGVAAIEEVTEDALLWSTGNVDGSDTSLSGPGAVGLIDVDGTMLVASIAMGTPSSDPEFGAPAIHTRVDAFADWLDEATADVPPGNGGPNDGDGGEEPDDNEPDEDDEFSCESFFSEPFPFLRLLISFLTDLLERLQNGSGGGAEEPPTQPEPPARPSTTS